MLNSQVLPELPDQCGNDFLKFVHQIFFTNTGKYLISRKHKKNHHEST